MAKKRSVKVYGQSGYKYRETPTPPSPTTPAPTTEPEPTTEAEYTGEMAEIFGTHVLYEEKDGKFNYNFLQILILREDKTCSLLGEEYTWTAQNSTTVKLWKGETFAGTVAPKNENTSILLWSDPDKKEQKTFTRNDIPEDYSAVLKLAIKNSEREDDECASEIVFKPHWEVLIGEKTYHVIGYAGSTLSLYGDDGVASFYFELNPFDYNPAEGYQWERGIYQLWKREKKQDILDIWCCATYVDENQFDIVELTVDNFMDYFELVSRKEPFVLDTDGFGDLTSLRLLADCVMPKETVEFFEYTVQFSR